MEVYLRDVKILLLLIFACFILAYLLAQLPPVGKVLTRIIATIAQTEDRYMVHNFFGGSAQSTKCTPESKSVLNEPKAIFIDIPENGKLVGNVSLRVYLLVTCEDVLERKWRIKVNDITVTEDSRCFGKWTYIDLSFPASYLNPQYNKVSLECEPTNSGSFYIGLGKTSEGTTEFFRTTYSYKLVPLEQQ